MSSERLCGATLARLKVSVPSYDRSALPVRIVHLGAGAFHRSHQAYYLDQLMEQGHAPWGILAASFHGTRVREALAPQDHLYTLLTRDDGGEHARVIGSFSGAVSLASDRALLVSRLLSPATEIVSLTVTEKGYCYQPATGELDETNPEIVADLETPLLPRTAVGLLALAVFERKRRGARPFTVLSCDNLPSNGLTVRKVLRRYLELAGPGLGDGTLARHFEASYACPCTMVDRITPATTDEVRQSVDALLGVHDASPVVTEPFTQWVVEDHFSAGRPRLEDVGVTFTGDVRPFEEMKLRMLNGAHSSLAYLGGLLGRETVAEAVRDPVLAAFVEGLMTDAAATLRPIAGVDYADYRASLLQRFRNGSIRHLTAQIAMDGSQKLPQRILAPLRDRLAAGVEPWRHVFVVAAWIRHLQGRDEQGRALVVNDPLAGALQRAVADAGSSPERLVGAVLEFRTVFGDDLPRSSVFVSQVTAALGAMMRLGVARALAAGAAGEVFAPAS
ncbi:Fructuronate reductase OS=Castellaniella defragrans OX=75697 GN=HNR28_001495 PE=4 SV=1 [Castellaniella defragrans]